MVAQAWSRQQYGFQSTLPLRGATLRLSTPFTSTGFQSTLPLRGATSFAFTVSPNGDISIHAPLAGSDDLGKHLVSHPTLISIHAPLAGSDPTDCAAACNAVISIHAPLAGSDKQKAGEFVAAFQFQSTLPLRGATSVMPRSMMALLFQSTLPLRGATVIS